MICIIGSGLSAMAAATALVQRGCRPTILDPGLSPEPEVLTLKAQLATVAPEEWKSRDLACVKQAGPVAANGIPRKLHFGSDFVFRDLDPPSAVEASQASMHRSFAAGGFSVVWGAVIQPLPPEAMKHWPVTREELKPHYAAVRRLFCDTPEVSGMESFTEADPITEELRPSSQARALYANLWTYRQHLARSGIRFGYAQHAVRAANHNGNKGCCYCGLCLHGCPYDCKYSAATTMAQLVRHDSVRYLPGLVVDRVLPDNGRIRIETRSLADGEFHSFRGD
jgi:choline dehydrogenase-like flavoprotein